MKKIIYILLAFACVTVIGLTSCASHGKNFKEQNLSMLHAGTSTYSEVCTSLGSQPTMKINIQGGYQATWQYTSAVYTTITANKLITIEFDVNDVMTRVITTANVDIPASQRKQLGM